MGPEVVTRSTDHALIRFSPPIHRGDILGDRCSNKYHRAYSYQGYT